MQQTSHKISDTQEKARKLVENLGSHAKNEATVVALYGDLGAGKTTFIQFFGEALGVKEKILSPTFVIEKIYKINYKGFEHLVHIDAYRLDDPKELRSLGWDEVVKNPKNIVCIEWADKVETLLPEDKISIRLKHITEDSRHIEISNG